MAATGKGALARAPQEKPDLDQGQPLHNPDRWMPPGLRGLVDYSNPRSLGSRLRRRRSVALRSLIEAIHAEKGAVHILDIGGRRAYWASSLGERFLAATRTRVTLLNLAGEAEPIPAGDPLFRSTEGDALVLTRADMARYDIAHANSVIEHVGRWQDIEKFAALMRMAPAYYCQTPYFWFPIEPHTLTPFFHWLPESLRAKAFRSFNIPHYPRAQTMSWAMGNVESIKLLDRAQFSALFPDARIAFEWLGLPKSLIAIRTPR